MREPSVIRWYRYSFGYINLEKNHQGWIFMTFGYGESNPELPRNNRNRLRGGNVNRYTIPDLEELVTYTGLTQSLTTSG
jgi:hypothetical protein